MTDLKMSYAEEDPRTPRSGRKARSLTPRGGDAFEAESRKVQEAVRKIQQQAADVRKEANLLRTAPANDLGKCKDKAQAAHREGRMLAETATSALHGLHRATNGTVDGKSLSLEEQNSRRFMHQKLTENVTSSMKALDQAWVAFQTAEAEAVRQSKQAAVSSTATPLIASGREVSVNPATELPVEPAVADDLESGRKALCQEQDVPAAEAEMHAAIAEEYANDMQRINENAQMLQRAMVDLAETTTSQGSILDNIESNMTEAVGQTQQANQELTATAQAQQGGMKKFMWIMVVAGSVAAVGALFT